MWCHVLSLNHAVSLLTKRFDCLRCFNFGTWYSSIATAGLSTSIHVHVNLKHRRITKVETQKPLQAVGVNRHGALNFQSFQDGTMFVKIRWWNPDGNPGWRRIRGFVGQNTLDFWTRLCACESKIDWVCFVTRHSGRGPESEAQLWLPFLHSTAHWLSIWGHWFWGVGHVVCVIFARGKSWSVVSGHCCLSFLGVGSLRGFAVVGVMISLFFSIMELCECSMLILYVFGWRFLRAMVKTVRFVCWLFWFLWFYILGSGMFFCGCFRLLCLVCVVFFCFLCAVLSVIVEWWECVLFCCFMLVVGAFVGSLSCSVGLLFFVVVSLRLFCRLKPPGKTMHKSRTPTFTKNKHALNLMDRKPECCLPNPLMSMSRPRHVWFSNSLHRFLFHKFEVTKFRVQYCEKTHRLIWPRFHWCRDFGWKCGTLRQVSSVAWWWVYPRCKWWTFGRPYGRNGEMGTREVSRWNSLGKSFVLDMFKNRISIWQIGHRMCFAFFEWQFDNLSVTVSLLPGVPCLGTTTGLLESGKTIQKPKVASSYFFLKTTLSILFHFSIPKMYVYIAVPKGDTIETLQILLIFQLGASGRSLQRLHPHYEYGSIDPRVVRVMRSRNWSDDPNPKLCWSRNHLRTVESLRGFWWFLDLIPLW